MALYTNELAAERMRERARSDIERAKQLAALEEVRRREQFQRETNPDSPEGSLDPGVLGTMSREELYRHAKQIGVRGRSKMTKEQLIEAVRHSW